MEPLLDGILPCVLPRDAGVEAPSAATGAPGDRSAAPAIAKVHQ